jgi:hypothetical protein
MRRVGESAAVTPLRDDAALVRPAARNNAGLEAARRVGFRSTGALRVWVRE